MFNDLSAYTAPAVVTKSATNSVDSIPIWYHIFCSFLRNNSVFSVHSV